VEHPHPELPPQIYLSATPFQHLIVEIDYIEGCRPDPDVLQTFTRALRTLCEKPEGIRVLVDDEIPDSEGDTHSAEAVYQIAQRWRSIATPENTAHIYVLYLRKAPTRPLLHGPHGIPIILIPHGQIQESSGWIRRKSVEQVAILHELGHVLGLVSRGRNQIASHCTDPSCVMYSNPFDWRKGLSSPFHSMFGKVPSLFCSHCKKDLSTVRLLPLWGKYGFDERGAWRSPAGEEYTVHLRYNGQNNIERKIPDSPRLWRALLADPSVSVRFYGIGSLTASFSESSEAPQIFSEFLDEESDESVRLAALSGLRENLSRQPQENRPLYRDQLLRERLLSTLSDHLQHDNSHEIRLAIIQLIQAALTPQEREKSVPEIPSFVRVHLAKTVRNDSNQSVRAQAMEALALIHHPEDIDTLCRIALQDEDPWIRELSIRSLFFWGRDAEIALPTLEDAQKDPVESIRNAAKETMIKIQAVLPAKEESVPSKDPKDELEVAPPPPEKSKTSKGAVPSPPTPSAVEQK
jgi:hypothetical protein